MIWDKVGFLAFLIALNYWAVDAFLTGSLVATISSIQERELNVYHFSVISQKYTFENEKFKVTTALIGPY